MHRRRTLICLLALPISVFLAYFLLFNPVSAHRDGELIAWLKLAQSNPGVPALFSPASGDVVDPVALGAEREIRKIGTNAIPILLRLLRPASGLSSLESGMATVLARLPEPWKPARLIKAWSRDSDESRALLARSGFSILGSEGEPAIPGLVALVRLRDPKTRNRGLNILSQFKGSAVLALGGFLEESQPMDVRRTALSLLEGMGAVAGDATAAMAKCATNRNDYLAEQATTALAQVRTRPEIAVPALIAALDDPRSIVRISAARSLRCYGPDARRAVPRLEQLAGEPDAYLAELGVKALRAIEPDASTNWLRNPLESPPLPNP